jgi:RNA polymerase sigma-70 factor (ECF subfamily)
MTQEADEILVRRALAGDAAGFARLCERYYPALVMIAHAILLDGHLAEDVAQETIAEACRRLRGLRRPERFGPWLGAICRNIARDMLRDKHRRPEVSTSPVAAPEEDRTEESVALREAVASLPEPLRRVVLLRYSNEMTYEQMAGVLGLSEQAINGRLRRAKERIAAFMKARGLEV